MEATGPTGHNGAVAESTLPSLLGAATAARASLIDDAHQAAFRLFNGHLEGDGRYVIDVYGTTAVIFHHAAPLEGAGETRPMVERLLQDLPWLGAVVLKEREGAKAGARRGRVVYRQQGADGLDTSVSEHGVSYAVELLMNQDASYYLDTRPLRRWLIDHSGGKQVLNTFAYTGSLGVAARAGGARRVVHTDLNARFLNVAKASYALNGFGVDANDFQAQDFWSFVRGQRLQHGRFDTVVLDPPFFSTTRGGTIDLNRNMPRLINAVRPLVRSGGTLVTVNNALFLSGAEYMRQLQELCAGGWLTIDRLLDVPEDITGFPSTRRRDPVTDPAPFNHATKIALLGVRHRE